MPNGLKKLLVNNVRDVDLLLMHNKSFAAEIAHGVSSRNRIIILERFVSVLYLWCARRRLMVVVEPLGQRRWA